MSARWRASSAVIGRPMFQPLMPMLSGRTRGKHPGPGVELDAGESVHGQEHRHDREAEERGGDLVVARDGSWALDGDGDFGCFHVTDLPWCWLLPCSPPRSGG